jgi:hypothetical protein
MGVSLDLSKAHLSRQYGDISAIFSWINDERALFMIPSYRKGAPWFVVMEPAAHLWNDQDPKNIAHVLVKSAKACDVLGIEGNPSNCRRIAGIVNDSILDLVRMPSAPPKEYLRSSFGHMELRADGEVMSREDIKLEKDGAEYV